MGAYLRLNTVNLGCGSEHPGNGAEQLFDAA
jgi:hypothetical protein